MLINVFSSVSNFIHTELANLRNSHFGHFTDAAFDNIPSDYRTKSKFAASTPSSLHMLAGSLQLPIETRCIDSAQSKAMTSLHHKRGRESSSWSGVENVPLQPTKKPRADSERQAASRRVSYLSKNRRVLSGRSTTNEDSLYCRRISAANIATNVEEYIDY